jgi:hypothetical protein
LASAARPVAFGPWSTCCGGVVGVVGAAVLAVAGAGVALLELAVCATPVDTTRNAAAVIVRQKLRKILFDIFMMKCLPGTADSIAAAKVPIHLG